MLSSVLFAFVLSLLALVALSTAHAEDGDMVVTVTVRRGATTFELPSDAPVAVGDKVTFNFTSPVDGFVYLFSCGPAGDVFELVPSKVTPNNRVKRGEALHFGPFPVTPPTGDERLVVVFSPFGLDTKYFKSSVFGFFAFWKEGGEAVDYVWNVGEEEAVPTSKTRGAGTEIHYTPVVGNTTIGPFMLRSVNPGEQENERYRCPPEKWGTRGGCSP